MFARHGLSLNRVEHYPIHGGSLRLFIEKRENVEESVKGYLAEERRAKVDQLDYYIDFAERVRDVKTSLRQLVGELKEQGKTVVAYGAAAKGAIMLNYAEIGPEWLDYVVDRNTHKQGRYMPGVDLPILDPSRIVNDMPDYVLLLPWNFKDEILSQQQDYINQGGRFIIPIPEPVIV